MREASFIIPTQDNDGADLADVHAVIREELIAGGFGGFTVSPVQGFWRDETTGLTYSDNSLEYRLAADWTAQPRLAKRLFILAARFGVLARQEAVYVRDHTGEVWITTPAETKAPLEREPREFSQAEFFRTA